ncbi:S-adenosyl-L-methionine-dependent methyltransferases superfamily protein [Heracleum sosnowskyi]|uniref:S-adenosyl-L-methionine-dependent methyltransferases superfamily protein n=1 Tax=Heracleum sosnowskyi TaxID=360622 RepID=A0AAD8HIF7_9APIA|nr:S-adenosyl-L-methionine-dependent methyltransferases superfamily protein [Heracleum sosnowskyi]
MSKILTPISTIFFAHKPSLFPTISPFINPKIIFKFTTKSINNHNLITRAQTQSPIVNDSPTLPDLEDVMLGYMFGKKKATQIAHSVWKCVVQKGDAVIDATCGNGYDTLAMLKMVADRSQKGRVYALDLQDVALQNTRSLLDESLDDNEKELAELFATCHSKMEEVLPRNITVRLVAFNLGYLPGGDKTMITKSETTLLGLEAAERVVAPGGLISLLVYVGHPGGREEFETVQAFASRLPVDKWSCCKLEMLNKPLAPIIVFLFKR